ncbi:MAG: hypothetical protein M1469_06365 [Bacteroidetes bacterium]|nr:hypothetical protein [Bacteroidota bacterium]
MKKFIGIVLASWLTAIISGCKMGGAPILQFGTPRFVEMSQPDSLVETGIGQDPKTGGIYLQWYSTIGASGYKVFRTDSLDIKGLPTGFVVVGNVISSSALNDTSMVDVSFVMTGVKYYYYIRAYASDGSQSTESDTINYTLLDRPSLSYPGVNAAVGKNGLYFSWHDNTGGGYTVIRVEDASVIPSNCVWVSKRFQLFGTSARKSFNFDSAAVGQLVNGHPYQWRVDRFNPGADEGARSIWQIFMIQ